MPKGVARWATPFGCCVLSGPGHGLRVIRLSSIGVYGFCADSVAENTGDPVVAQELARHKDLRTTQGYLHPRLSRVLQAAVKLNRK